MKQLAILFDLDGTLLPMDYEEFTGAYFRALCKKLAPLGYPAKELIDAIWAGVKEIVKSDGSMTGEERFWREFAGVFGERVYTDKPVVDSFYSNEFHTAKVATPPTPLARTIVDLAHQKADTVLLATNPIFPYNGVISRMSWAGLKEEDFDLITSYETSCFCKPNPRYYQELMARQGLFPDQCVMIGNDVNEDIAAAQQVGIRTFLITDCLLGDPGTVETEQGTFQDAVEWVKNL
ncbi:MAG: HAD family hydrolase [Oscillospiraceae bacterium]|nr:HAD family hydrolase [Oscillospiraceae bacterium]